MNTTNKQIAANRKNAIKSTGPVTPEGKIVAARNSLKHGLLAKEIVINAGEGAESQDEFNALLSDLKDQFDPQGTLEEMLVEKIAASYWRLRRAHCFEVGLIRQKLDTATDNFYSEETYDSDKNNTDEEIDKQKENEKEYLQDWQNDKAHFAKMYKDGSDLKETYDYEVNWESLYEEAYDEEVEVSQESSAGYHQYLNKLGWSDDKIWQYHLKICDDNIAYYQNKVLELEKEKQKNHLRLDVRKKLGSIPEGRDLDRLLKYEGSIDKQFYKAINQLERLQRLRKGDAVPAPINIDLSVDTLKKDDIV